MWYAMLISDGCEPRPISPWSNMCPLKTTPTVDMIRAARKEDNLVAYPMAPLGHMQQQTNSPNNFPDAILGCAFHAALRDRRADRISQQHATISHFVHAEQGIHPDALADELPLFLLGSLVEEDPNLPSLSMSFSGRTAVVSFAVSAHGSN